MSIEITGLDELESELNKLGQKAESLSGEVGFDVLFNPQFMREHTDFATFEDLLSSGGWDVKNTTDFEAIPEDEFNSHISKHTKFSNWEEMKKEAAVGYISKGLGF